MRDLLLTFPTNLSLNENWFFWQHDSVSVIEIGLHQKRFLSVISLDYYGNMVLFMKHNSHFKDTTWEIAAWMGEQCHMLVVCMQVV